MWKIEITLNQHDEFERTMSDRFSAFPATWPLAPSAHDQQFSVATVQLRSVPAHTILRPLLRSAHMLA